MRGRPVCILCLLLVVFLCVTDWLGFSMTSGNPLPEPVQTWIKKHPESTICGEVVRCQEKEETQSVYLKNTYLIYNSEKNSEEISTEISSNKKVLIDEVKVNLNKKEKLPAGSLVFVSGKLTEVEEPRNPGEFDSRQYYRCRHIYYMMNKGIVRRRSSFHSGYGQFLLDARERFEGILDQICGQEAGIFQAMVLGEKSNLDQEVKLRYQMAGIIHILAISGLHISLLGVGLYNLLKRAGLGIWPAGLISLVVMLQYGLMTGGSVSTMRAVCMFLLFAGAKIAGRIYDLPTALAASAILILVESPGYLLDGGFLMSFGAVLGIGVVFPAVLEIWNVEGKILRALFGSVVVQLTTLPIVLWFYGEVSVVGIFLNLLVLPTAGIVLGSGVAGALTGLFFLKGAAVLVIPGRAVLKIYELLGTLAGRIPFGTWILGRPRFWQIVGYYVVCGGILWTGRKYREHYVDKPVGDRGKEGIRGSSGRKKHPGAGVIFHAAGLAAVCLAVFFLSYRQKEALRITFLDVGQGDGIVVEAEGKWNLLIDGGSTNKSAVGQYQILPYLKYRGISRLDGIYISHTDEDHISGVRQILEYVGKGLTAVKVDYLILPDWGDQRENKNYTELTELAQNAGISVLYVKRGDRIQYGQMQLDVLWPPENVSEEEVKKDINEEAMVLELKYGELKGLFTGDIGQETEAQLKAAGVLEDVDFLKVAHHGSRYSTGMEFLETVTPEVAVISCSATNTYGHPSPETLERLKDAGVQVLITKDTGAAAIWKSTMSTTQKNLSEKKFSVGIFGVSKNGGR